LHVQVLELFGSGQGGRIGRILQVCPDQNHPAGVNGKSQHGKEWNQQEGKQRDQSAATTIRVQGEAHDFVNTSS
jgi:hypothetical protein